MLEISEKNNGFAVASLVLGIVSVVFCFFGTWAIIGLATGIVGIVLAVKGQKSPKKGLATAGLVLSIIGVALCGIMFIFALCVVNTVNNTVNEINSWY